MSIRYINGLIGFRKILVKSDFGPYANIDAYLDADLVKSHRTEKIEVIILNDWSIQIFTRLFSILGPFFQLRAYENGWTFWPLTATLSTLDFKQTCELNIATAKLGFFAISTYFLNPSWVIVCFTATKSMEYLHFSYIFTYLPKYFAKIKLKSQIFDFWKIKF